MSSSDQTGRATLTRKQMRELRLTGSTPVIDETTAATATAAAPPQASAPAVAAPAPVIVAPPVTAAPVLPRAAEPAPVAPAPVPDASVDLGAAPLTRRQAREQERIRTASVPVIGEQPQTAPPAAPQATLVSEVPAFSAPLPVSEPAVVEPERVVARPIEHPVEPAPVFEPAPVAEAAPVVEPEPEPVAQVNPAFGRAVAEPAASATTIPPSFDELVVGDSAGSQHSAPSALIFTQGPTEASLSGPVASTGEVLITGTYELPRGLGSRGHADGTTDGKDVDVVLIDGELPATSSPTPIAASAAVSTSKPAGEVIRPPAPEKGNRLMMTLAIVAGGLALALGAALVIAFTTNVFG